MKILAKTYEGLEGVLSEEIKKLGGKDIRILKRSVQFSGDKKLLYSANYNLRTAVKILVPLKEFKISKAKDLYANAFEIPWFDYFGPRKSFAVESVVNSSYFKDSRYASLLVKDAIADKFREKYNMRPDVDSRNPQIKINVYINRKGDVVISLDSSGEPLFKRKYRTLTVEAPLSEVLAAGLILLSGWDKQTDFVDFMCGSGTLPIEAYLYATNTPPQILRRNFAFKNWNDFDNSLWNEIVISSKNKIKNRKDLNIFASDKYWKAILAAKENARNLGIEQKIKLIKIPFEKLEADGRKKFFIVNPPYDIRNQSDDIYKLYEETGEMLKSRFKGGIFWILSSNLLALTRLKMKFSKEYKLLNGKIKVRFRQYEIW